MGLGVGLFFFLTKRKRHTVFLPVAWAGVFITLWFFDPKEGPRPGLLVFTPLKFTFKMIKTPASLGGDFFDQIHIIGELLHQ
ncbi:hypothetical protein AKG77_02695 [Vibrio parahaemolyticus]|nr:hypothetical protein AKG77_02695 [Vibrio parahaemolyticus]